MPAADLFELAGALDLERIAQRLEFADVRAGFAIEREHDVALRAARGLIIRESGHRLTQAARTGVRPQLGGQVENACLQRPLSPTTRTDPGVATAVALRLAARRRLEGRGRP